MKDLLKKAMEVAKKHLTSIIYAVIALCAIGAIFWPINGKYDELNGELAKRKQIYGDLQRTLTKTRQTPGIPGVVDQGKLEHFPTKPIIKEWEGVTEQVKNESKQMFDAAVEMNKRTQLLAGVLPDTPFTSAKSNFRKEYKKVMDLSDETTRKDAITKVLQPGFLPTEPTINEAKNTLEQQMLNDTPKNPATNQPLDPNFDAKVTNDKAALPGKMRAEVAQSSVMYVDPGALDPQPPEMLNLNGPIPDPGQIYIAQVSYWIQKDVVDSLAAANKDARNVKDATVKHLWKIKFWTGTFAPLQASAPSADAAAQSANPSSEFKFTYTVSPTGRESNGVYDVYRFGLRLFVDADRVDQVIRELTRGKLINVLSCDVISRDTAEYQTKDYYYGDRPIVQLDLQCEALLLRDWTQWLMPPSVRTALGVKLPDKAG